MKFRKTLESATILMRKSINTLLKIFQITLILGIQIEKMRTLKVWRLTETFKN